jgi:3-polyprenyl-4-hydroxybenzoate decarboxylase
MRAMQQHVTPAPRRRMIVGISGAAGIICRLRIREVPRGLALATHLVMSKTMVNHPAGRVRDLHDLDAGLFNRWGRRPDTVLPADARAGGGA